MCDGMDDESIATLGGKTPFEAADTPALDALIRTGSYLKAETIPDGLPATSEVGNLSILGYLPDEITPGRAAFEAIDGGMNVNTEKRYARVNRLKVSDGKVIDVANCQPGVVEVNDSTKVHESSPYDLIGKPHNGSEQWIWSEAEAPHLRPYSEIIGERKCAMVAATPLIRGIGKYLGFDVITPEGATGDCATDYRSKADAAIEALKSHDMVFIHVESCDEASHRGAVQDKVKAIENIDSQLIAPILAAAMYMDFSLAVLADHPSLCRTRSHIAAPVNAIVFPKVKTDEAVLPASELIKLLWQR